MFLKNRSEVRGIAEAAAFGHLRDVEPRIKKSALCEFHALTDQELLQGNPSRSPEDSAQMAAGNMNCLRKLLNRNPGRTPLLNQSAHSQYNLVLALAERGSHLLGNQINKSPERLASHEVAGGM
jgi:hypothetical protein